MSVSQNNLVEPIGIRELRQSLAEKLGVYLLHRLQSQFRGVQSDGARALRAAQVRADDL